MSFLREFQYEVEKGAEFLDAQKPGWEKRINMATACSGGRGYAGTESIHLYFSLPWELVDLEIEGLRQRAKVAPYPGLITIPLGVPKSEKHFFRENKPEEDSKDG